MARVEVLKEVVPGNTTRENIADTSEAARPAADQVPLLVDLDSCLIRTDLLLETAISYLGTRPLRAFHLLVWLFAGRPQLKRKLGEAASLDLSLIPIDETIADYARNAKRQGRQVYLVTASDEFLARKIATRFDFLDGVIASDGNTNLKGVRKSEVVRSKFRNGFDYIGDSNDDLHVWRHARNVIAVRPSASLLRQIQALDKPTELVRAAPLWRRSGYG